MITTEAIPSNDVCPEIFLSLHYSGHRVPDRHIDESVFALSLARNLTVSKETRVNDSTFSSVSVCVYQVPDYTGVGIVSVYLFPGFVRTSCQIDRSAPHFLYLK